MTSTLCWECGVRSHMTPWADPLQVVRGNRVQAVYGLYVCDNCQAGNLASTDLGPWFDIAPTDQHWRLWQHLESTDPWTATVVWHPRRAEGQEFPDVPDHIAGPASEAYSCHQVSADRAAIMVARAVVEATAKNKGITKGNLLVKIDALKDAGHIRPHVAEMAHEIRHFGNDMAHGDFDVDPTSAEAEDVLGLMSEVLVEVYQSPARVAAIRARREARETDRDVDGTPEPPDLGPH